MDWYYVENGQQAGPVDDATLTALVQEGRLEAQTLVWNASMTNWEAYGQLMARMGGSGSVASGAGGVATQANMAVCVECGRAFPPEDMILYSGSHVCAECKPVFFQKIKEGVNVGNQRQYAGFWIRCGAKVIDGLILLAPQLLINIMFFGMNDVFGQTMARNRSFGFAFMTLPGLLTLAINFAYYVYLHGLTGQTIGKKAVGIRVIRSDGSPITYGRALGRFFADILSARILCIGYIMAGFDEEKRALHDRICDTRVVYVKK